MKVKLINSVDVPKLLDEILAWKPSEIIMWSYLAGHHAGTDYLCQSYYAKLLERQMPPLNFLADYNELSGRVHWRSAVMLDPRSQLANGKSASPKVYAPERGLFATIALGSAQYEESHETENELLLFAVADDVKIVWPADTDLWLKKE